MYLHIDKKTNKFEKKQKQLSLFICHYLLFNSVNLMLQLAFGFSGALLSIEKMAIQGMLFVFLILIVHRLTVRAFISFIFAELLGFSALLYSYLVGASISEMSNWGQTMITVCIPLCVCAYLITDYDILLRYLEIFSWPILIILIVTMVLASKYMMYSMHFSYSILLLILIHFNSWMKTKKVWYLIVSVAELLLLVAFGSRGALVCIIVFVALKFISFENMNGERLIKKILLILIVVMLGFFVIYLLNSFGDKINNYLISNGHFSRTFNLIVSGEFVSYDSNRNAVWDSVKSLIAMKPFQGWGIGGASELIYRGVTYPHQLFLDLVMTFGYPIGLALSFYLIILVKGVITVGRGSQKDLLQIFVSIAFTSLMFTATVFTSYYFFIMLGLLLSYRKRGEMKNE